MLIFEQLNAFYTSRTAFTLMLSAFVLAAVLLLLYFILMFRSGRGTVLFPISFALLFNGGLLYLARTLVLEELFTSYGTWIPTSLLAIIYLAAIAFLIILRD